MTERLLIAYTALAALATAALLAALCIAELRARRAALKKREDELEKALDMSRRANGLTPGNATFLDTEGWILYLLGRYDEARTVMQQAVSFDMTGSPVLLFHYAEILYALGDAFMAEVYWKRALEKGYDARQIELRLKQPAKSSKTAE